MLSPFYLLARRFAMRDMFASCSHCMQVVLNLQTAQAVKDFAWLPIPFANGDLLQSNEFGRLYKRWVEFASNAAMPVLHKFSFAAFKVRSLGTSGRKPVI